MKKSSFKKQIKFKIKKALYNNFNWYRGKNIGIHLQGGLCNKLLCLSSACDIAIKENATLIEPYFGWNQKILFSEIYDLDYFNEKMSEYTNSKQLIIARITAEFKNSRSKSIENVVNLWEYSEKELFKERNQNCIDKNSSKLRVLKALRLRPEFNNIVKQFTDDKIFTAVQIRTEEDWIKYASSNKIGNQEKILVPLEDIISMLSKFNLKGDLFFTSGQNHKKIFQSIQNLGVKPSYFFNPHYEYEINAAINFDICCRSEYFIGLSRSSYSNLISLKRGAILNKDQSFIYNYKNEILQRIDMGIQYVAIESINMKTEII